MAAPKPFTVEPLVRTVGRDIFPAETRFLVVDDVDSMRSIVRAMIRDLGYYSIMEAHDATKGHFGDADRSRAGPPDRRRVV